MAWESILSANDLDRIRKALLDWGKPASAVHLYTEKMLWQQIEIWKGVVNYIWTPNLSEKYAQDVTVRYWIQIAIEHSSPDAGARIEKTVAPLDQKFRSLMKPRAGTVSSGRVPLNRGPYFWEENSILG